MKPANKPLSIWLIGLSGSGKTTIAKALECELKNKGIPIKLLDGDVVRQGLNTDLGFSDKERIENIRRIAEVNNILLDCGITVINSFICPTDELRALAKSIITQQRFILCYVDTPLAICEERDVKGLYQKARKGEISSFTGIDAPFETPYNANVILKTDEQDIVECVEVLKDEIINFKNFS